MVLWRREAGKSRRNMIHEGNEKIQKKSKNFKKDQIRNKEEKTLNKILKSSAV